jgi:hypothetical protein
VSEPRLIHFFQRHIGDDAEQSVPVITFLDQVPDKVAAEMQAVLEAVAEAPLLRSPAEASGACGEDWCRILNG